MKILITNYHLENRAGSELFTKGVSLELKKRGYEIFVFSTFLGNVSREMEEKGVIVVDDPRKIEEEKIDIIHAQHNITAILARSIFPQTPMVFMSHGVLPELEQPPSVDLGISKFLAVSEEVAENLKEKGVPEEKISIVRNFIDLERFSSKKKVNQKPKRLLVLSNHYVQEVRNVIKEACGDLGIEVFHVGLPENSVENVEDEINKADVVVTLGRGALEAMACERNVIVYDIHGGDGIVEEKNFFELRKNNFSGRYHKSKYSADDLKRELAKYNPSIGHKLRKLVEKENSIDSVVGQLTNVYEEALQSKAQFCQIGKSQLFDEFAFLQRYARDNRVYSEIIQNKELEVKKMEQILRKKSYQIRQKSREIELMKNSKFWKMREKYLYLKNGIRFVFFYPNKFIEKHLFNNKK